ncbi:hypothetical protein NDU88_011924 [Pleurodeles waltl]|uniref:Uncharacterized protein n=1 Tax=Pleurodeles waltl TaxID=8319 RepID=A0AAV7S375_PLEWA|nr:hypothetical protein NDU88_011924 [Pleurodeles waltl]
MSRSLSGERPRGRRKGDSRVRRGPGITRLQMAGFCGSIASLFSHFGHSGHLCISSAPVEHPSTATSDKQHFLFKSAELFRDAGLRTVGKKPALPGEREVFLRKSRPGSNPAAPHRRPRAFAAQSVV